MAKRASQSAKTEAQIGKLERETRRIDGRIQRLRTRLARKVPDYTLTGWDGKPVKLSKLFGRNRDLILVHNMGKACPYCTIWADGFNGVHKHIAGRAAFVVASPDHVATQKRFAKARGWGFRMVSSRGSPLFRDMGFEGKDGGPWPGVTTFRKRKDGIRRIASAPFGPGDKFCSVFNLFDLLPMR
jgi:predicted dithiol-disulfide oxidoreductase (DUF899 family)